MPGMGRPPVAAAKAYAIEQLVGKYEGEFKDFQDEYFAKQGWGKVEKTVTKWEKVGASNA